MGQRRGKKQSFFAAPQKAKFAHSKADEQKAKDSFFERHYTQSMNIKKVRYFDRLHSKSTEPCIRVQTLHAVGGDHADTVGI